MKRFVILSFSLLLLLVLIPGCFTIQTTPPGTIPPTGTPSVGTFSSSPSTINSGGTSTLVWNVTGANMVSIDNGIGQVEATGTRTVAPTSSTIYTISATNSSGTVTRTSLTTVNAASPILPVVASFYSSPAVINIGDGAVLQWNVSGCTSVTITPGIGNVSAFGSQNISPTGTTTYTLIATNSSGSVAATSVLTVNQPNQSPVIVDFNAGPSTLIPGQSTTLYWNVTGATNVSIDNGIGSVSMIGSRTVMPVYDTTYRLTASNGINTVTRTVSVILGYSSSSPVISGFTASPATIIPGQTSMLQWNISGATSVSIDQGIGPVSASGSQQVSPYTTTTYTITASNSYGSVTSHVIVSIGTASANAPVIVSFTAVPSSIGIGQYSYLLYIIQGDPTIVTIDQGIGTVNQFGVQVGPLAATTTYNITAANSAGSVTRSATVTVH